MLIAQVIKTENLRKFLARRRWQRCGQVWSKFITITFTITITTNINVITDQITITITITNHITGTQTMHEVATYALMRMRRGG